MRYENINLAEETINTLVSDGYELVDIDFISLEGVLVTDFFSFAAGFDYYPGYGCAEVPPFVIAMQDGSWYERREYDGAEWWRHVVPPTFPIERDTVKGALYGEEWAYPLVFLDELDELALEEEREWWMDSLCDEIEDALWRPDESISGKWDFRGGRCATKSHCQRWGESDRPFTKGGGSWAKHNSRCWKDQRGKGKSKRYHQYR